MFGVSSVICGHEELNIFFNYYLQLDTTSNTGNMDSDGTFTFVDDVLLARTVTRTCTNSVSVASARLDTSFNLNVMPYFFRPLSGSEICCKCSFVHQR